MSKNNETKYQYGRRGVSTMEYGLLAALIGLVALVGVTVLGSNASIMYCTVSADLGEATPVGCTVAKKLPIIFTPQNTVVLTPSRAIALFNVMFNKNAVMIDGLYDQYGRKILTVKQYLQMEGVNSSDYTALMDDYTSMSDAKTDWENAGMPSSGAVYDAYMENIGAFSEEESVIQGQLPTSSSDGARDMFVPDSSNLYFLDANGQRILS